MSKHEMLLRGKKVIASDTDMDIFEKLENWSNLVSFYNPDRIGTKDVFICYMKDRYKG